MSKYFKIFFSAFLVAVLASVSNAEASDKKQALVLRGNIIISENVLRVGDLFENAGDSHGLALYRAPRPGKQGVLNATRLKKRLARFNLHWENKNALSEVIVRRASQMVPFADIETALKNRIASQLNDPSMAQDMEIQIKEKLEDFYISDLDTPQIDIRHMNYNARTGRFSAILSVSGKNERANPMSISGLAYEVAEVAVLRNPIERNDTIGKSDINIIRLPVRQVSNKFATSVEDLEGRKAKKNLSSGRPIRKSDIALPRLVNRGDLVTVLYQSGNLTITARGVAMENGVMGRSIRIKNPHSKRMLEAVVTGPSVVKTTPLVRNLTQIARH